MRTRNNRIVVRLTDEQYEKMNDFCKIGKLSKEFFWLCLVKGEDFQEGCPNDLGKLICLLRNISGGLNSPKNYFNIDSAFFASDLKRAIRLLDETEDIISYEYYPHTRKYFKNKLKWSVSK